MFSISGSSSRLRTCGHDPADDQPDRDAAGGLPEEVPAGVEQQKATTLVAAVMRDPVGDERGRVVDQRLALEHRHEPRAGRPAGARSRSPRPGRSGRRSPQRERRGPGHAVDQRVRDDRDDEHRDQHEPDRQQRDRPQVRRRSSRRLAKNAPLYSSGGRNSRGRGPGRARSPAGRGASPSSAPPSTSTIGYGTLIARAAAASTATARQQRDEDDFELVQLTRR